MEQNRARPQRTLPGMPQTPIVERVVASKFLHGHRRPAPHTRRSQRRRVHEKIDNAISDKHAHHVGDLPPVQHPSYVKGVLEEPSHGEKNKSELIAMARMRQRPIPQENGCAGRRVKRSRTHIDVLLAPNAKQAQQSMLNVRLRREFEPFERTRRSGWRWDCLVASTWHRAHPSVAPRVKLLSIVDVAWNLWMVENEFYISRQDESFFHSFSVHLPRAH